MPNSFIENLNTVANATALATGAVIEDAQLARDAAAVSATAAATSETNASTYEATAQEWSEKQYNSEVEVGKYSAYHWSVVAAENAGENLINDAVTSANTTWSSSKLATTSAGKASIDHTHDTVYEPVITKGTAFNKDFIGTAGDYGTSVDVARGNHTHTAAYEPKITTKNTAFNKNFGSTTGTVAEGDHTHSYMPLVTAATAYNKPFVVNTAIPGADEIPRGNHVHPASGISHDGITNTVATSSTVQGAISQLDGHVGNLTVAEVAHINAGMSTASDTVTITTAGVGVELVTAMTAITGSQNTLYSAGRVTLNYPTAPDNLIEGWYTATVTTGSTPKTIAMAIAINGVVDSATFKVLHIPTSSTTESMSITRYITGLENADGISVFIYNMTDTTNLTITAHTVAFSAKPQGSLVAPAGSVDHSNLTGTGAPAGVHTISDISGDTTTLQQELDARANLAVPAAANNIALLSATGDLVDSTIASTEITAKMAKVGTPTLDNIVTMTSGGDSKDGGIKIANLALANGHALKTFKVATATHDTEAVNRGEMNTLAADYVTDVTYQVHATSVLNPHSVTAAQVGAATASHAHAYSDISDDGLGTLLLADDLAGKYAKVATPVTNNIVAFQTGGLLQDSGVAYTNIVESDIVGVTGADQITNMMSLTQAEYDAIVTPNASTFYIIVG